MGNKPLRRSTAKQAINDSDDFGSFCCSNRQVDRKFGRQKVIPKSGKLCQSLIKLQFIALCFLTLSISSIYDW